MLGTDKKDTMTNAVTKVVLNYKNCDGFLYDRMCKYAPTAKNNKKLQQIKYYGVDNFHGKKHSEKCKYCAKNCKSVSKRFKGVNGSSAEHFLHGLGSTPRP